MPSPFTTRSRALLGCAVSLLSSTLQPGARSNEIPDAGCEYFCQTGSGGVVVGGRTGRTGPDEGDCALAGVVGAGVRLGTPDSVGAGVAVAAGAGAEARGPILTATSNPAAAAATPIVTSPTARARFCLRSAGVGSALTTSSEKRVCPESMAVKACSPSGVAAPRLIGSAFETRALIASILSPHFLFNWTVQSRQQFSE